MSAVSGIAAVHAIRLRPRTVSALAMASFIGVVAFCWPFVVAPGRVGSSLVATLMFGQLLLLVLAVVLAEVADGGIDAKALALLGVLSAVNAGIRTLGAGTGGIETVFFLIVLSARVFGPGFGFTLGATSLFASALITSGVGPWLPYQMFGCAWVGLLAGLLPGRTRLRGKAEIVMLAVFGAASGYLFGLLLNLSFWPFSLDPNSSISYVPGLSFTTQWHRFLVFDATTSLGWDTGRAVTSFLAIIIAGPAVLSTLRRAARKAAFEAPVHFLPTSAVAASAGEAKTPDVV
jgi:energy-coupling factor transport system substrate-specific component